MDGDKARFLFGEVPVGLDPDDPDDRAALLALDDGEELSEFRSAVREVVAAQIADDDPPEVWATAQRLLELGWEREEVLNQLCLVFAQATHRALGDRGIPFEQAGYGEMLARLPLPRAGDVVAAVVAAVREAQPVPIDDVNRLALERLGLAGDDLTEVLAHKVIDELLDDPDGPLALLSGDLTVHVEDFCSGIVLTHRLTEEEAEAGVIPVEFDLAGFARRDELRLAGGDPLAAYFSAESLLVWQGPEGWLGSAPAGALVAVRVEAGGLVTVEHLAEEPPLDAELVTRLRAVYDEEVAEPWLPVGAEDLLLGLLAADRRLFARPRPPLQELCAAAGLERRGNDVAHEESVWVEAAKWARTRRVYEFLEEDSARRAASRVLDVADSADPDPAELRKALDDLDDPEVAVVVLDEVIPVDDPSPEAVSSARSFAERLVAVAASPGHAGVAHWVAAVVAERVGEPLVADAHLGLALEADPDFAPAVERAAWYASDRGDAATATRLWGRLEDPNPEDLAAVEPFARGGPKPGRNEPCWCGSGQKFKTCHLGEPWRAPLPDRVGWLCRKAVSYVERRSGQVSLDLWDFAHARAIDPDDFDSVRDAFSDPIVVDATLVEGGWFERFLADRGPLLPDDEALLARSWTLVPRTVYEVLDVAAGEWLTVRDLRTGDCIEVRERTFSRQARPGLLICGRAVTDGVGHQFVGGLFPVAPGRERGLLDLCDEGDPETLCYAAGAGERPPILQTREGEPIVTCTAVLEVGDPEVAAKVLDGCYEAKQDGWVEFFALGEDEVVLRAELRLEGCLLTVATHSEARLDRVLDVLAAELPDAVVVSDERVPLPPGEFPAAPSLLGGADPPEAVKLPGSVVVELADRLERRWLDESVPALDGLTPRQAASDPTRLAELQRLIDSFPEPQPDGGFITLRPERLRRLLGLPSRGRGR